MALRFALVVVNYNQKLEAPAFFAQVAEHWPRPDTIVVDDGSRDGSPDDIESLGWEVVRHERNRGVGAAIRTGIVRARERGYEAVVVMSSNGKMVPAQIGRVVGPVAEGRADYVTGNRFLAEGERPGLTLFRSLMIPVVSLLLTPFLGRYYRDITCGFRAYRIDFLFTAPMDIMQAWLDRYEMEYYVHYYANRLGLRIEEVPVTIRYDHLAAGRKSKIRPGLDWMKMLYPIPLLFFRIRR